MFHKSRDSEWFYRLKQIDFDGQFAYSPVVEAAFSLTGTVALRQNYPNPFNPETLISFTLPTAMRVELIVHDLLGRVVETLVEGSLEAGRHHVVFEAQDLPSGIYVYQLMTPTGVRSQHMLLLR